MPFFANRSSRRAARLGPALAAASALALGGAGASQRAMLGKFLGSAGFDSS